jgi:hypothetical protein
MAGADASLGGDGSGGSSVTSPDGGSSTGGGASEAGAIPSTPEAACRAAVLAFCERAVLAFCERRHYCSPIIEVQELGCTSYADLCPGYYFDSSDRTVEEVAACAEKYRTASCSDFGLDRVQVCGLHPGMRAAGEHCVYSGQCQTGHCSGNSKSCGTCDASTAKAIGQPCSATTTCVNGAFCHPTTRMCTDAIQYGGEGAMCNTSSEPVLGCEKSLLCVAGDGGTVGTCMPPGREGEPCPTDAFTRTHRCMPSLECKTEGSNYICRNPQACGATTCDPSSYCSMGSGTPICAPKAKEGEPCGGELVCMKPIQCTRTASDGGATCLKPEIGLLNQSCNPSGCLAAYACRDGKCVPFPASECPAK